MEMEYIEEEETAMAAMQLNGVRVEINESNNEKIKRALKHIDLNILPHSRSANSELYFRFYFKVINFRKYNFFSRLFNFSSLVEQWKFLGEFYANSNRFFICHRDNLPLDALFIKKLSKELGANIVIVLNEDKYGERIEYNPDDPHLLNIRRQFLEKERLRFKRESERIENELADVHKKMQALSGGGGPYRAISAVE